MSPRTLRVEAPAIGWYMTAGLALAVAVACERPDAIASTR
jgi:hypothetical protein